MARIDILQVLDRKWEAGTRPKDLFAAHVAQRNRTEAESWRYNPCPLISSTMSDCLDRARDLTQGGARYNASSISLVGLGTVIDAAGLERIVLPLLEARGLGGAELPADASNLKSESRSPKRRESSTIHDFSRPASEER